MLMAGTGTLQRYAAEGRALGAFSVYNMEMVQAIVGAAEEAGLPVLVQAGASAFGHAGRDALAGIAVRAARAAGVPVGVHLDHSRSEDEIAACIELGYTSVMIDGSHLPFAENVELTRRVVERAHAHGVWVEGELGAIAGDEDRSTDAQAGPMTGVQEAAEFAAATGVDALAVAVGNVHGFAPAGTTLDLERLGAIARACPVPLVLHGASGVEPEVLTAAAGLGVVKFNVNTELRRAFFDAVTGGLDEDREGYDLASLLGRARAAVSAVAGETITLLATPGAQAA